MIIHSVFFKLIHPVGGEDEAIFFSRLKELKKIDVVRAFKLVKEVSPKNEFDYGLVMELENQSDLKAYNHHPDHIEFVNTIWIPQVQDFLEIDYVSL